jgi:hypothetical protein
MKKISILLVMMMMVLLISVNTLGAIKSSGDEAATIDHWYSVEPDAPYFVGSYYGAGQGSSSSQFLNFDFYQNDQSFFDFSNIVEGPYRVLSISGSFLAESGFFIGAQLATIEDAYNSTQQIAISPGIRAAIDENSYLAASMDLVTMGELTEINAYEINGKLFAEGFKIAGDYIFYPVLKQTRASLEADLVVSEHVIAGFNANGATGTQVGYSAGFTYSGENLTVDAETGYDISVADSFNCINGVFNLSESLRVGANYTKYNQDLDGCLILKVQLGSDNSKFVMKYNSANNNYAQALTVAYEREFDK